MVNNLLMMTLNMKLNLNEKVRRMSYLLRKKRKMNRKVSKN